MLVHLLLLLVHLLCSFAQALSHVPPLRNYFLREQNYAAIKRPPGDQMFLLVQRFGELIRKLWNPRNFKAHVSPHEMLQAVVRCSKKKFQITEQGLILFTVLFNLYSSVHASSLDRHSGLRVICEVP
jgi:hypothetical protein